MDGDGWTNEEERKASTDSLDALSFPAVSALSTAEAPELIPPTQSQDYAPGVFNLPRRSVELGPGSGCVRGPGGQRHRGRRHGQRGLSVTKGAYDVSFHGGGTQIGSAGLCDVFVAKFSPSGELRWATYLGVGAMVRDFELDSAGNVVAALGSDPGSGNPPAVWFSGAYQPARRGGIESGVAKLAADRRGSCGPLGSEDQVTIRARWA